LFTRRQRRVFLTLALMAALAGTVAGFLSWLHPEPRPYFVPLFVTNYRSRLLSDNPLADRDRQALRDGGYFPHASASAAASQERHLLLQELAALRERPAGEDLVVYLAAFAGSDAQGGVFLLPADVDPDADHTRLPLREVLEHLRACPCRRKLLVLDIMGPVADARLGILANDAAANVEDDLHAVPDPNRLVLCVSAPGQVALGAEELGRSAFGYYWEQALRGHADGWNPQRQANGRVSVTEAAAYVQARVDRWAQRNRQARQTPVLHGTGEDFELIALAHGTPTPTPPPPELPAYPPWLLARWKLADEWYASELPGTDPRLLRQLRQTVLLAESAWRQGWDRGEAEARLQAALRDELDLLQRRREQALRMLPHPEPRALALAFAGQPDPGAALSDTLRDWLIKFDAQTRALKPDQVEAVRDKLTAELLDQLKAKPPAEVAWAVFDQLVKDPNPRPERVRLLQAILAAQQPLPRYVETLFLARLAERAGQASADGWPVETVRLAARTVRAGEQAAASPRTFPWTRGLLDAAAQQRHNAEVLFWSPGFAPADEDHELFQSAHAGYENVLAWQSVLVLAQRTLDEALLFLPDYADDCEQDPAQAAAWQQAVAAVRELLDTLTPPPADATLAPAELRRRVDEVSRKTAALQRAFDPLRQPFGSANVARLIAQARRPDAGPAVLREVQALLAGPFLAADDRAALWRAGRELALRLHAETAQLDAADDQARRVTLTPEPYARAPAAQAQTEQALRRARQAIALLQLGGLPAAELAPLADALHAAEVRLPAHPCEVLATLGRDVRDAWARRVPVLLNRKGDLATQDRISRVLDPFQQALLLDTPQTHPTLLLRAGEQRQLLAWLADRYRYEARDLADHLGATFYAEAANACGRAAGPADEAYIQFTGDSEIPQLTPARPEATYAVRWTALGPSAARMPTVVRLLNPDAGWLRITPDRPLPPRDHHLRLHVALRLGAEPAGPVHPRGFLVQVDHGGRTFHHKVRIPTLVAVEPFEVLVSTTPDGSPAPLSDLTVRPGPGWYPVHLWVRNNTDKGRNLLVELVGAEPTARPLAVGPRQTQRLRIEGPAPKPGADLPELRGPLLVRLRDPETQAILAERRLRVRIASPREYVEVTGIEYIPAHDGQNHLRVRLRARGPLAGRPCVAELVLDPEQIPGLLGVQGGTLRGALPADGKELTLHATGLRLAPSAAEEGTVSLTIDGCARCFVFRVTFARQGDRPLSPREVFQPALRIRAARFARAAPGFPATLQADSAPADATLELSLGQMEGATFIAEMTQRFPAPRQERIGFWPSGPDGGPLVQAGLRDWTASLDLSGVTGPRVLRARLLSAGGQELLTATAPLIVDGTPPEGVAFVDPPQQAVRTQPLTVQAAGRDPLSGIDTVVFFVGRPADGKPPPTAVLVPGRPAGPDRAVWTAKLTVPPDPRGSIDVTAQFINGVGESTFATTTIELLDKAPPPPTRITGTVCEGPRPQPGLDVVLRDEKGAIKARTKTADDGTFTFENIAPGTYKVSTSKPATQRKGEASVTVEPGQTAVVKVLLSL
jgi:hypothetical protein